MEQHIQAGGVLKKYVFMIPQNRNSESRDMHLNVISQVAKLYTRLFRFFPIKKNKSMVQALAANTQATSRDWFNCSTTAAAAAKHQVSVH